MSGTCAVNDRQRLLQLSGQSISVFVSVRLIDACDQESHIQPQPRDPAAVTLNQCCCRLALLSLSLTS